MNAKMLLPTVLFYFKKIVVFIFIFIFNVIFTYLSHVLAIGSYILFLDLMILDVFEIELQVDSSHFF